MFHMPVPLRQLALILLLPVLLLACSTAGPAVDAAPDGDKDSRIEAPADDNGSPGDEDEEDSGSEDETGSDEDSEDSTGDAPGDEGDDAEEPGDEDSDVDEPGEASVSIPGFSFTPDPFDFGEGISQAWLLPLADRGDHRDAIRIATLLVDDRHDLIHKAVGWMLREVDQRASHEALTTFLVRYAATMPRTMLRYAIERLPLAERRRWMNMAGQRQERNKIRHS